MATRSRVAWLVVAVLATAWVTTAAQTSRTLSREFDRSVEASDGGQLTLDLRAGGDVYLEGWNENRVDVRVRLRGRSWQETDVVLERVRGGVRLRARAPETASTAHRFDIRVPRRYNLQLDSARGRVSIRNVEGTFTGRTGSGSIDLERVRGRVELTTASGQIRVRDADVDGFVTSGRGPVSVVNNRGRLWTEGGRESASGLAGDVKPPVPRSVGVQPIGIRKGGGDVRLAEAPGGADVYTGGGAIRIGRSSGSIRAVTGGGTIELGPVQGSVVAKTGNGDVRVSIVDAGPNQTIDIDSGLGAVILELPPTFSAELDLETAYTNSFGGSAQIKSSWALEREETTDWDATRGTPRRYVRSRGPIGNGGATVRVRTVNGDITVRQASQ